MSRTRTKQKTLIITEDEEEAVKEEEELNPFSFKQFLRSKNLDSDQDQDSEDQTRLEDQSFSRLDYELLLDQTQERAWGQSWASGGGASAGSLCAGEEEEEEEEEEVTRFDSRPDDNDDEDDSRQSYEGDDETSILEPETKTKSRTRTSLQQVKQENEELKKTVTELRQIALKNRLRAEELSVELRQRQQRDQQEALDLETMVQSVEHNLRLMTTRAQKSEASVSKLKAELKQLQVRFEEVQAENAALRASESELVLTMRQNALTASERLQETAASAHSSVRRLLSEAESLRFVSELLQSIDRMSTVR